MTYEARKCMFLILGVHKIGTPMGDEIARRLFLISKEPKCERILQWLIERGYHEQYFLMFFKNYKTFQQGLEVIKADIDYVKSLRLI